MKKVLLFAALFVTQAQAANWVYVSSNAVDDDHYSLFELDTQSILSRDGMIQAWVRFTSLPAQPVPGTYPVKTYKSYMSLDHYDCNFRESTSSQTLYYSDKQGTGENLGSERTSRDAIKKNMQTVAPGTYGETLLDRVCALSKKK